MRRKKKRVKQDPTVATILMVILVVMAWALAGWLSMVWFGE